MPIRRRDDGIRVCCGAIPRAPSWQTCCSMLCSPAKSSGRTATSVRLQRRSHAAPWSRSLALATALCGSGETRHATIPGADISPCTDASPSKISWECDRRHCRRAVRCPDRAAPPTPFEVAPGCTPCREAAARLRRKMADAPRTSLSSSGPDGVIVVDTGISYRQGEEIIAAVKSVSARPIRLAILTHPESGSHLRRGRIPDARHSRTGASPQRGVDRGPLRDMPAQSALGTRRGGHGGDPRGQAGPLDRRRRNARTDRTSAATDRAAMVERARRDCGFRRTDFDADCGQSGFAQPGSQYARRRTRRPGATHSCYLASLRCRHLVPGYGPIGNCADIAAFAQYFAALENRVKALLKDGVSLGELRDRCDSAGICALGSIRRTASTKRLLRLPSPRTVAVRVTGRKRLGGPKSR